jgi:hypothetical protein
MEIYFIFGIFIMANSYFMYKTGQREGRFEGMLSLTQFFRTKRVLKDKSKIVGFKNWPMAIQMLYTDPREELFED